MRVLAYDATAALHMAVTGDAATSCVATQGPRLKDFLSLPSQNLGVG
jgi:hypothetical protein